jgi:hypothetical protein
MSEEDIIPNERSWLTAELEDSLDEELELEIDDEGGGDDDGSSATSSSSAEAAAEAAGAASTAAASAAASASASLASCCLMRPISVRPNTEPMRVGSTPYSAGRTTVIRSAEAVTAATPVDFNRWPVDGRSALDGRFALYMRVSPVT